MQNQKAIKAETSPCMQSIKRIIPFYMYIIYEQILTDLDNNYNQHTKHYPYMQDKIKCHSHSQFPICPFEFKYNYTCKKMES